MYKYLICMIFGCIIGTGSGYNFFKNTNKDRKSWIQFNNCIDNNTTNLAINVRALAECYVDAKYNLQ